MTQIDYQKLAEDAGLERISGRMPFWRYLGEAWRRRGFALSLARYQLEAEYGQSRLGLAWVVIKPMLMVVVYGSVFSFILPPGSRPENFISFLVVGVFIFEFFSKCFTGGTTVITGNVGLVRSLTFPRLLLPFSLLVQRTLETIPMMAVMGIVVLAFGEPLQWSWLLVIPILMLMTVFNFGVALIASRLTVHFRDVTQIVPFVTRVLFYSSGIFYSLEKVLADKPTLLTAVQLSPVHDYIALVREQMVTGVGAPSFAWTVAVAAAFLTLAFGLVFFWAAEERYGLE